MSAGAAAAQDDARPLRIAGRSDGIIQATVRGPFMRGTDLFLSFEDYHNPRVQRLRSEYDFLQVIADEPSEFRRQLLLRHWVCSQLPIDDQQRFGGDVFAILEHARNTGEGFHCSHTMKVQQAVMTAAGFVARNLGVDRNHEQFGRSYHHGVNEIWSNEYAKWVMLDAKYDNHFERDGVPLSALEVHEAIRGGQRDQVRMVVGPDRTPAPHPEPQVYGPRIDSYWWVSYHVRQNVFTQPHVRDRGALVIHDNQAFREDTWYRGSGSNLRPSWAYASNAFIPATRNQIEWTPGVTSLTNIRQARRGWLVVQPRSVTPNFKEYRYRINGGQWNTAGGEDAITWPLEPGDNTLEVHTRNLFEVDGPSAIATVHYQPRATPQ